MKSNSVQTKALDVLESMETELGSWGDWCPFLEDGEVSRDGNRMLTIIAQALAEERNAALEEAAEIAAESLRFAVALPDAQMAYQAEHVYKTIRALKE